MYLLNGLFNVECYLGYIFEVENSFMFYMFYYVNTALSI